MFRFSTIRIVSDFFSTIGLRSSRTPGTKNLPWNLPKRDIFEGRQLKSKRYHLLNKVHKDHTKPILNFQPESRNVSSNWKDGDKDGDGNDKDCDENHEEVSNACEEIQEKEEACEEIEVFKDEYEEGDVDDGESKGHEQNGMIPTENQDDEYMEEKRESLIECEDIDNAPSDISTYKNEAYFQYGPYSYYDYFVDMKSKDYFCPVPSSKEPLEETKEPAEPVN